MQIHYSVPLAMLGGIAIGAFAVQTLHAQAKPPVYVVSRHLLAAFALAGRSVGDRRATASDSISEKGNIEPIWLST
jgi:hypothetical protein